jgi:Tol biopolymer transport system component
MKRTLIALSVVLLIAASAFTQIAKASEDVAGKDILGLVGDGHAPALSEDGAAIVYYDEDYQIWTVNADGTGRTQLTSGYFDLNPAWSPDGKKIAFRRSTITGGSSYSDIWIMNGDGTGQTALTDARTTAGYFDRPSWSPEGTRIAMEAAVGGMMSEIYVVDLQTQKIYNVTAGNSRENNRINHGIPAWLADGERIAHVRNDTFSIVQVNESSEMLAGIVRP